MTYIPSTPKKKSGSSGIKIAFVILVVIAFIIILYFKFFFSPPTREDVLDGIAESIMDSAGETLRTNTTTTLNVTIPSYAERFIVGGPIETAVAKQIRYQVTGGNLTTIDLKDKDGKPLIISGDNVQLGVGIDSSNDIKYMLSFSMRTNATVGNWVEMNIVPSR